MSTARKWFKSSYSGSSAMAVTALSSPTPGENPATAAATAAPAWSSRRPPHRRAPRLQEPLLPCSALLAPAAWTAFAGFAAFTHPLGAQRR